MDTHIHAAGSVSRGKAGDSNGLNIMILLQSPKKLFKRVHPLQPLCACPPAPKAKRLHKADAEDGRVGELGDALNVEQLLHLGPSVHRRLHRLGLR